MAKHQAHILDKAVISCTWHLRNLTLDLLIHIFLLEPLRNLSKTYTIDTIKGHFPHHFNRREKSKIYIGCIPCEEDLTVKDLSVESYEKDFKPWYDEQLKITNWNSILIIFCNNIIF